FVETGYWLPATGYCPSEGPRRSVRARVGAVGSELRSGGPAGVAEQDDEGACPTGPDAANIQRGWHRSPVDAIRDEHPARRRRQLLDLHLERITIPRVGKAHRYQFNPVED